MGRFMRDDFDSVMSQYFISFPIVIKTSLEECGEKECQRFGSLLFCASLFYLHDERESNVIAFLEFDWSLTNILYYTRVQ